MKNLLDELPSYAMPEKCERCGSTELQAFNFDPDGSGKAINCNKCPDAHDFGGPLYEAEASCKYCEKKSVDPTLGWHCTARRS
jgi:hypothetical protein